MNFTAGDVLEQVDLNNMVLAHNDDSVISGLAVSQRGAGANMSVDVATGSVYIAQTTYTESGVTNLSIDNHDPSMNRKDLITYDPSTSAPVVTKGTNHAGGESDPTYPPDIPAGDILLAIVNVDANASATDPITDSDIVDKRILQRDPIPLTYSGTNVYSATAPTSWTDLDLSSVVGSNRAIVLLKVHNTSVAYNTIALRTNGDTDEYYNGTYFGSPSLFRLATLCCTVTVQLTDATGKIEIRASGAAGTDIDVLVYAKLM